MKLAIPVTLVATGIIVLAASRLAIPAAVGMEASAAAGQVKTGDAYLQSRVEMEAWRHAIPATRFLGGAFIGFGAALIVILSPKKQTT